MKLKLLLRHSQTTLILSADRPLAFLSLSPSAETCGSRAELPPAPVRALAISTPSLLQERLLSAHWQTAEAL